MKSETLTALVREAVPHKVSLLCADQWPLIQSLADEYPSRTVDHSNGQNVAGAVHTQTIEGFWSLIKGGGVAGTFHKFSKKYLPSYVDEFKFRDNSRMNADIFRARIKGC